MSCTAQYMRDLRAARPEMRDLGRWQNRTRHRALERLAVLYAEEFAELVADERQREPDPRLASHSP